jgi:hypothetical protein
MPSTYYQTSRTITGTLEDKKMTFAWSMKPAKPDSRDYISTADSTTNWFKSGMVHTYTTDSVTIWDVRPTLEMAVKRPAMGGYYKFDLRNDTVSWKTPFGMLDAGAPFEVPDTRAQLAGLYAQADEIAEGANLCSRKQERDMDYIYNKIEALEAELENEDESIPYHYVQRGQLQYELDTAEHVNEPWRPVSEIEEDLNNVQAEIEELESYEPLMKRLAELRKDRADTLVELIADDCHPLNVYHLTQILGELDNQIADIKKMLGMNRE